MKPIITTTGGEFIPRKSIVSRYATTVVNPKYYTTVSSTTIPSPLDFNENKITELDKVICRIKKEIGLQMSITENFIHTCDILGLQQPNSSIDKFYFKTHIDSYPDL